MATTAYAGPGFLLKYGTVGAGTYPNTIGQVRDIKGPEQTAEFDDITNQSSPAAVLGGRAAKEWIPTLIDGGTTSFPIVYDPADATQTDALGDLQLGTLVAWQLVVSSSGSSFFFNAYVAKFGGNFPYSKAATIDVDLKITGPVTKGATV